MEATVVIVGFGAAGACAAIEAAESGADVLVVDRFTGGGATAISGGIVYAGGGTRQQITAGIKDDPEMMYAYLRHETRDAVSAATLRRFCDESAGQLAWLEDHGVPFDATLCPYKTSYPTNRHYLYQSGSEHAHPDPAPRGHRTHAPGTSGGTLYAALAEAALARGVRFLPQTRAVALESPGCVVPLSQAGRDSGTTPELICSTLRDAPLWARFAHRTLHRWSVKPGLYLPGLGRALHRAVARIEQRHGRELRIRTESVVLAAGGFVFGREMMREHAPGVRGLRLGTHGDDGSGIRLGTEAGAGARHLDRISLWRFLTPPSALAGGLLVDRDGRRVCDESLYGAAIGDAVRACPDGKAWLLLDRDVFREARQQLLSQTLWFQRWQSWWLFTARRTSAPTLAKLARRAGIDPDGLAATVSAANLARFKGAPDPTGKPAELTRSLERAPYSLLDVSLRAVPAPMLTLGGLTVDEDTGEVLRPDGSPIPGLYAAGRTAVGICSGSYVSGLSLADCVFSGRRAGRHAAACHAAARHVAACQDQEPAAVRHSREEGVENDGQR
ncbi:23S rRNA methyltransferase [Actinoplanes italicus]|uniref:3-oxo-5alpha-steroid 4-dehydrogenase n=1 Tax=Actinoplanes italicus TaxID=113567 RepID=A0A2T0K4R5_9ACTN|nr:3-oxo-5alpha-steroid 4-dehydrogenase [Actinoplanes italicus]GIE35702.1 23S rRNA methyltransferase [Actinoplanes italicus]